MDRYHESRGLPVPAVLRDTTWSPLGRPNVIVHATNLTVVAAQQVDDQDLWFAIAGESRELELTVESARRLSRTLTILFSDLGPGQ